jgi:hypothetical protein
MVSKAIRIAIAKVYKVIHNYLTRPMAKILCSNSESGLIFT